MPISFSISFINLIEISHEIRTPIASVIDISELLLSTDINEEQQDCAENIQISANGLLTIINDILDISKVGPGRLDTEGVQFSLPVVICDVQKMMSFASQRKNVAYQSDIEQGIDQDLGVIGDPGRLRQVLTNILINGIKFASEGYARLEAPDETIHCRRHRNWNRRGGTQEVV